MATLNSIIRTAAVLAVMCATASHAATIDFEPIIGTIEGTQTLGFEFEVAEASTFIATLSDLATPAPFTALGLAILNEQSDVLGIIEGTGILNIEFTVDPGTYIALVGGVTDPDVNIGTFGLDVMDMPIPGAVYLFGTALFSMLGLSSRRQRKN